MLRIAQTEAKGLTTLTVEGRLVGPWVEELRRACDRALDAGARVRLELAGLSFLDRGGAELLLALRRRHVALAGAPGFVTEQLRTHAPDRWSSLAGSDR